MKEMTQQMYSDQRATKKLNSWTGMVATAALLVTGIQHSLFAFPRLTAEQGGACNQCHISPAGGGARNEFGNYTTALQELCLPATKKLVEKEYKPPRIGEALLVGFDARWLVLDDPRIFRMQTDLFATLDLLKNLKYHLRFSEIGIDENYALLSLRNESIGIKIGRFYPAFGLRQDDHTAYTRAKIGFGPRSFLDGLSVYANLSGAQVFIEAFDPNQQGMLIGHLLYPTTVGPLSGFAGGSVRFTETVVGGGYGAYPHLKSAFGGLSYDRLTLTAEGTLIGKGNDALAGYVSSVLRFEYGLYGIVDYNFYDPDRRIVTGTEQFWRYSVELYPLPFVQIRPSYSRYTVRADGTPADQWFVQFHIGY
jgi:hypothetical protein